MTFDSMYGSASRRVFPVYPTTVSLARAADIPNVEVLYGAQ